jgi:hypothetical protein
MVDESLVVVVVDGHKETRPDLQGNVVSWLSSPAPGRATFGLSANPFLGGAGKVAFATVELAAAQSRPTFIQCAPAPSWSLGAVPLAVSPDSRVALCAAPDDRPAPGVVPLLARFDLSTGTALAPLRARLPASLSTGGARVATPGRRNELRVLDDAGREIAWLGAPVDERDMLGTGQLTPLLTPDGAHVVAFDQGRVFVWGLPEPLRHPAHAKLHRGVERHRDAALAADAERLGHPLRRLEVVAAREVALRLLEGGHRARLAEARAPLRRREVRAPHEALVEEAVGVGPEDLVEPRRVAPVHLAQQRRQRARLLVELDEAEADAVAVVVRVEGVVAPAALHAGGLVDEPIHRRQPAAIAGRLQPARVHTPCGNTRWPVPVRCRGASPGSAGGAPVATADRGGMLSSCPGWMRSGLALHCGFASRSSCRVTPWRAAIAVRVSPRWTV